MTLLNSVCLPKHHCLLDGFLSNKVLLFIDKHQCGGQGPLCLSLPDP